MGPSTDLGSTESDVPVAVGTSDGLVVARNGARLPPRCIKCNAQAEGNPIRYTFVDSAVGGAPRGVVTGIQHFSTRRKGVVYASLCHHHRRFRRLMYVGCPLLMLVATAIGVWAGVGFEKAPNALVNLAIWLFMGGLLAMGAYNQHNLKARIHGETIVIGGAGVDFVASIRAPRGE